MKKLTGIILGTLLGVSTLLSQNKTSLTGTYNITDESTQIRLENLWNNEDFNSYGFLDAFGNKNFNFENFYTEVRVRKNFDKGLGAGLELNAGTGYDDKIRAHVSWSGNLGPIFVDLKYSPVSTEGWDYQAGIFAATNIVGFGLSGWVDFNYSNNKVTPAGEVQLENKIGETNVSVVGKVEKFPWQESPKYSLGIKYEF